MTTLKAVMRELRADAEALLNKRDIGDTYNTEESSTVDDESALLAIAIATLRRLELCGASCAAEARQARKALKSYLVTTKRDVEHDSVTSPAPTKRAREKKEEENTQEEEEVKVNLGQYANSHAFGDDVRKQERFARLMGGKVARTETLQLPRTKAADARSMEEINRQLVAQYDAARTHKGKKGLGA